MRLFLRTGLFEAVRLLTSSNCLEAAVGTTNTAIGTNEASLENHGVYSRLERGRRDKKGLLPWTCCNG